MDDKRNGQLDRLYIGMIETHLVYTSEIGLSIRIWDAD